MPITPKRSSGIIRSTSIAGYFVETDRQTHEVPSPFVGKSLNFLSNEHAKECLNRW